METTGVSYPMRLEQLATDPVSLAGFTGDLAIEPVATADAAPSTKGDSGLSAVAILAVCAAGGLVAVVPYVVARRPS